ncbi:LytR/AlgR family response regulator transcription factor [Flagellimonas pacifica]|uniref:Two component transcriptional regulator, LytTR family n=1 Tax=Flagellimonas pacifica TaxID=1247520 RepID=A0A285MW57_9FLAO|nr:LytTR family transcriptional regulator DNA-binding domain-containing protein [Allomuricauda parva]SNZ01414.1 two component transcriptional regulator, LytTR family [Allomuricauda parva]
MTKPIQILIVEDNMVIGTNLSMQLNELGFEVCGLLPRGEDVLSCIRNERPDILLLDIQLKGKLDGIETARLVQSEFDIPIIYLTSNADEAHFRRAKETKPRAFISKPYKNIDLKRAIELTVEAISNNARPEATIENHYVLTDRVFVRKQDKLMAVAIKDIRYLEADRNYCRIFAVEKEYLLVGTLKSLEEKLPRANFMRVHRSYIINVSQIDEVGNNHVSVGGKIIPVNKIAKFELLRRLQTL